MKLIKKLIGRFSATQLTIISFLLMGFIGGALIYYFERDTVFTYQYPVLEPVVVQPVDPDKENVLYFTEEVNHTFVKEEKKKGLTPVDAYFTAVSALCVTGLTSIDFSQYTLPGQITTLALIQMGGLGIILFTSMIAMAVFRGLSERISLKSLLSSVVDADHSEVIAMIKHVAAYTAVIEIIAIIILGVYLQFFVDPNMINNQNPWWWSIFHSISAFNNAGFSTLQTNLVLFRDDFVVNMVISGLIILGGLGYPVLMAIHYWFRKNILGRTGTKGAIMIQELGSVASRVQLKVAFAGTIILLAVGTIAVLGFEYNSSVMADTNLFQKIMISFFHSVSARTAGFNSVDIGAFHIATIILYFALMFIGANPAGTAGGIKIPTVAALYGYIKDWFAAPPGSPVRLFGINISKFAVSHAIRLFFFSTIFVGIIIFLIAAIEYRYLSTPDSVFNLQKIIFEVFSAFGTVGLTMGYQGGVSSFTTLFTPASKLLIILAMYFGRVGPLTILQSLPWRHPDAHQPISPDFENSQRMQIG